MARIWGQASVQHLIPGRPGIRTAVPSISILEGKMPEGIDLILGQDWLTAQHATLDYATAKCTLGAIRRHSLAMANVGEQILEEPQEAAVLGAHPCLC
jgi:hypothetical protein